ncbi:hypothetical protein DFQ27_004119 [Actinomortierella ambigua]|uniref:Uncharacterized protein n=1 Tax=Actinomortierella ambigua TaxID=1343610 RepID=A0A9P6Q2Q2_9FUNG|nr:hypothetical protein DFQ27_004119 [Actinomortierella ambigua]
MDYLSLIKTIQYNSDCFGPQSALDSQWSTCGERLPSWISLRSLPLYSSRVEDMLSIRSLQIITLDFPCKDVGSWTTTEKEEVKFDLTIVSSFVSQWSAAYAKLPQESRTPVDIQLFLLAAEYEWWRCEPFASELRAIYLQMLVSRKRYLNTFSTNEWARFALAPESFDFSRVRSIIGFKMFDDFGWCQAWPEQGRAKVLQACRSLQKLELECWPEQDESVFQWAVQERQGVAAAVTTSPLNSRGSKPLGQPFGGLVPLSELKLELRNVVPSWQDAVFAFGTTLRWLTIDDYYHHNEVDLCVFHDMPVLRYLSLSFQLIKAVVTPFSGCPRLTEIYLQSSGRRHKGQDAFGRWDLAQVHVLSLQGNVCHQFNHSTLKDMPMLDTLIMSKVIEGASGRHGGSCTWDRSSWGPFPRLKTLELSGTMARTFCWSMLEQCPAVDNLLLDVADMRTNRHTIQRVKFHPFGQQPDFAHERSTSPLAVYPALRILTLDGYSISNAVLFDQLPRVAPNLTSLALYSRNPLGYAKLRKLWSKFKFMKDLDHKLI